MSASPLEQFDRTPVTFVIILAYVTLAFLTNGISPTRGALIEHGATMGILVQDGEPWRLLSCAFLHGGIIHILFVGYFLFIFGPQIETRIGSVRFAILYVVTAIGGSLTAVLWNGPFVTLVGGSGAIFGMLGCAIALFMREGRTHLDFLNYQGPRALLSVILFNLILGWIVPFISNSAHIGGLIVGFVFTFCFLERGRTKTDGLSRAIQGGWIVLYFGLLLYCTRPVLRWDYLYRQSLEAPTAAQRAEYERALEQTVGAPYSLFDAEIAQALPQLLGDRGADMLRRWGR